MVKSQGCPPSIPLAKSLTHDLMIRPFAKTNCEQTGTWKLQKSLQLQQFDKAVVRLYNSSLRLLQFTFLHINCTCFIHVSTCFYIFAFTSFYIPKAMNSVRRPYAPRKGPWILPSPCLDRQHNGGKPKWNNHFKFPMTATIQILGNAQLFALKLRCK